jgi:hypothetical protein
LARRHAIWLWVAAIFAVLVASGAITVRLDFLMVPAAGGEWGSVRSGATAAWVGQRDEPPADVGHGEGWGHGCSGCGGGGAGGGAKSAESNLAGDQHRGRAVFLRLCVRWPFRDRRAGRLLLDASRPRAAWVYVLVILGAAGADDPNDPRRRWASTNCRLH